MPLWTSYRLPSRIDGGRISSDGGGLLLAGADNRLGLVDTLAAVIIATGEEDKSASQS